MVSVLALYSDDPSSNHTDVYSFFCKFVCEKNENKHKEARTGPFFINIKLQHNLTGFKLTTF